eukprot:COSAG01_NODE_766_length_13741_cov_16.630479_12_plen_348_part_00
MVLLALAAAATAAAATVAGSSTKKVVDVHVDAAQGMGSPFVHKWKRSFGSGHASLTLRDDWRQQATQAADELGMAGVRYHGIYGDDNGPVVKYPGEYNFTQILSTWDFLHQAHMKPVVELSFMPAFLANCSWHGHCVQNPVGCQGYSCWRGDCKTVGGTPGFPPIVNPTAPACHAKEFHYQGIKQLPADFEQWYKLVYATASLAVERYGLSEVQTWSFECWKCAPAPPPSSDFPHLPVTPHVRCAARDGCRNGGVCASQRAVGGRFPRYSRAPRVHAALQRQRAGHQGGALDLAGRRASHGRPGGPACFCESLHLHGPASARLRVIAPLPLRWQVRPYTCASPPPSP